MQETLSQQKLLSLQVSSAWRPSPGTRARLRSVTGPRGLRGASEATSERRRSWLLAVCSPPA